MRIAKWIFLLLGVSLNFLYAQVTYQKGYLITIKGDTLKGEVKTNPKSEVEQYYKVYFKVSDLDKKTYKPDKVVEYKCGNDIFFSKKVGLESVFMKQLCKGKINLYQLLYEDQSPSNDIIVRSDYYMQTAADTIEPIKIKTGTKFRKQLAETMSDHKELAKDLDGKKYEYENMVEIFKTYNSQE